jgi:hypothetical protein
MVKQKKHICPNCREKIVYVIRKKPKICPNCEHKYSMKPEEEFRLLVAQDKYLESGKSDEAFREMYPHLFLYTKKILLKHLKGKTSLTANQVEEKVLDAVSIFMENYLKYDSFKVDESFAGYLNWVVRTPLYGYHVQKNDKEKSLNYKLEKYGNRHELIHKFYNITENTLCFKEYDVENEILNHVEVDGVIDDINCLIEMGRTKLRDSYGIEKSIQFLYGIQHFLEKKSDKFLNDYFEFIDVETKKTIDKIKQQIYNYLVALKTGDSFEY